MKKIWIHIIIMVSFVHVLNAQNDVDAFLFSQTDYQGTARYMGVCGAFSATGGDFSAINCNPAAIGIYKRSEISFTPTVISLFREKTAHYGKNYSTCNSKYTLSQFGVVLSGNFGNSDWKAWQYGFGYNRIMDFNNTFRIEGLANSTFINPILERANGIVCDALGGDAMLAWNTWLLDTLSGTNSQYFSPFENQDINQSHLTKTSGGIDEVTLSFGGNYKDKVFVGATVGMPVLDYTSRIDYREKPEAEASTNGISSYRINTIQKDDGVGINLKLGIIYQPLDFLRLGAAFQTPTYYWNIKDSYYREMISYFDDGAHSDEFKYEQGYNYALTTPLKANISASFLIRKRAFVAAEYEYTDYGMAMMYANDYNFLDENEAIRDKYGACHTIRVGGEVNITPTFVLRAGYSFKTSPYVTHDSGWNGSVQYASAGIGYRGKYCFADLAYVFKYSRDLYWIYDYKFVNDSKLTNTTHRIAFTIGCKF